MTDLLVVEDDITFSKILEGFLKKQGYTVDLKHTVKTAIQALDKRYYDLLLLDYRLPDGNGLEVLEAAKTRNQGPAGLSAVFMTSFNDVRTAVKAIRSGAFEYITKPVNPEELLMIVKDALGRKETSPSLPDDPLAGFIKGQSPAALRLYEYIELVAPTNLSVIIEGESGTGKEYVARYIHTLSSRASGPFIPIDCGALSKELAASELFGHIKGSFTGALQDKKGQFVAANGGTIFLDEVGNLSYDVQVKLLRALQERLIQPVGSNRQVKVDVRVIAATNDDLYSSVHKGGFREDLYHRLNEFKIEVPALRDRGEDLELFTNHFISFAGKELKRGVNRLSSEVIKIFHTYDWPGNLRELNNVVKRMVLLSQGTVAGKETLPDDMVSSIQPTSIPAGPDLKALQKANEKELIRRVLEDVKYNKSKAAKLLNIDRTTLYNKMAKYGIS